MHRMVRPEGDVQQGCHGLHSGGGRVAQRLRVRPGLHAPRLPSALSPLLLPVGKALISLAACTMSTQFQAVNALLHFRIWNCRYGKRVSAGKLFHPPGGIPAARPEGTLHFCRREAA